MSLTAACCLALWLTYCIHAVLWAGAAMLIIRGVRPSAKVRNGLWTMALLGPLLTTVCPLAFVGYELPAPGTASQTSGESHAWLLSTLVGAAVVGMSRFAAALGLLHFRLRNRRAVTDARWVARLQAVRARTRIAAVRLCESAALHGPLVIGRREICIPAGQLTDLGDSELDSVFAHELAHLERGDGLWFPIIGLLQSALWIHPITFIVTARIRETAELAADDRAVELTGDPLGLARALTVVADTLLRRSAVVPGMAHSSSTLVQRVARLTEHTHHTRGRPAVLCFALMAALGLATGSFAVRAATALDPTRTMDELRQRELVLDAELAEVEASPQASVRVLELQQALRHIRAEQAWTEEQWLKSSAR